MARTTTPRLNTDDDAKSAVATRSTSLSLKSTRLQAKVDYKNSVEEYLMQLSTRQDQAAFIHRAINAASIKHEYYRRVECVLRDRGVLINRWSSLRSAYDLDINEEWSLRREHRGRESEIRTLLMKCTRESDKIVILIGLRSTIQQAIVEKQKTRPMPSATKI